MFTHKPDQPTNNRFCYCMIQHDLCMCACQAAKCWLGRQADRRQPWLDTNRVSHSKLWASFANHRLRIHARKAEVRGGGAAKLPRSQQLTCRRLMPTLWPCHISRCSKRGCAPTATHNTHAWRCFKTKLRDHATSKTSIDEYMSAKLNSFVRALQTAVRHVQLIYSFVQEERVNFYKFVDSHFPEISGVPGAKINLITFSCNMRT